MPTTDRLSVIGISATVVLAIIGGALFDSLAARCGVNSASSCWPSSAGPCSTNARIDDLRADMNTRFADVNARIGDFNAEGRDEHAENPHRDPSYR